MHCDDDRTASVVWLLLHDLAQGIDGVTVQQGNCEQVMSAGHRWDVVYLDPMFAPRKKTRARPRVTAFARTDVEPRRSKRPNVVRTD